MNLKKLYIYSVLWLFCLALFSELSADILGSFDDVRNLPGYLSPVKEGRSYREFFAESVMQAGRDGIERRSPSGILSSYFSESGFFDDELAEQFIRDVEAIQQEAFLAYCSSKLPEKLKQDHRFCRDIDWHHKAEDDSLKKLFKKWKAQESYLVSHLAVSSMKKAKVLAKQVRLDQINRAEAQGFVGQFFTAYEAREALRAEDPVWGRATSRTRYLALIGRSFVKHHEIRSGRTEAANIPVPEGMRSSYPDQYWFSPEQLDGLEKGGVDTSVFDPPDSGFWRRPHWNLAEWKPESYHDLGRRSLEQRHTEEQIQALYNPDTEISVVLSPSSSSRGTTPKINVIYGDNQKWKMKFLTDKIGSPTPLSPASAIERVIISSEVNIEPAVNNLAAMLGFTIDPTYYKKVVRLYLPEEAYESYDSFDVYLNQKVIGELNERFRGQDVWNIRSAFEKIREDEEGKKYIEMRGVSLEKKSDLKTDRNVSLFIRTGLGKNLKREFRAFALFLALIQDPDVKDDNTKVKMIPVSDSSEQENFKFAYSNSDMGIALGFGFPNNFEKDLVKKVRHHRNGRLKSLKLNYYTLFPFPALKTVSFSDARWLMRMVSQIPANKIRSIFMYAGYPDLVAEYYTDIFLRRRDQLCRALGMTGKRFRGFDGKWFQIRDESRIHDPKHYAVPGYDAMFKKGYLNDPDQTLFSQDREFWPRDWGSVIGTATEGRHKNEIYKALTTGLVLQAGHLVQKNLLESFQFSNVMIKDNNGNPFCKNQCFYSGIKFGLDWFIPMRFVIENPTSESHEYPYWVVDIFRLAVTLGAGSDIALWGLGIPLDQNIAGMGGEFVFGSDMIKIRPVRDYAQATKLLQNEGASRQYLFRNLNQQIIDGMEVGDILVGSSYIGNGAFVLAQGKANFFASIGAETGFEAYLTNRIHLMKGKDDQLLASWGDLKRINVFADAFMRAVFIRYPLLKAEYKSSTSRQKVFRFDLKNKEDRSFLMENINHKHPEVPYHSSLTHSKYVRQRNHRFSAAIPWIRKAIWERGRTEVRGKNFLSGELVHELGYEREHEVRQLRHFEYKQKSWSEVRAQLDEGGGLFARIKTKYFLNQAYRHNFLKLVRQNRAFFPEDFIVFNPVFSKYYMGEVEFNSVLLLGAGAFDDLFGDNGPDSDRICQEYARIHASHQEPSLWCEEMKYQNLLLMKPRQLYIRQFLSRFMKTRQLYRNLKPELKKEAFDNSRILENEHFKHAAWSVLKSIVRLLCKNRKEYRMASVLLSFVQPEHFYRHVTLDSSMDGFPGLIQTLNNSRRSSGKLELVRRYLLTEVDDAFIIFSDAIDDALSGQRLLNRRSFVR
ncbi:MAG: hypothetical protein H6618_03650 [Deltaproteobacteria bacterium]|nr:hypothetical protein [Deltaproteobacteria bacterium]